MSEKSKGTSRETGQKKKDFSEEQWVGIKQEARDILIEYAKRRSLITYSDLAGQIKAGEIYHRSDAFSDLLTEISKEEDKDRPGMLSAIVVQKGKDPVPSGKKFYKLVKELDRNLLGEAGPIERLYFYGPTN